MNLYFITLIATALLADANLIWGALAQNEPWRLHLAALVAVVTAVTVVLALLRHRGWPFRAGAIALSLVLFLGIGLVAGGYDHIFPLVLAMHGAPIAPAPGGFWYVASGVLLLPMGLGGLATLKHLNPTKEEQ